MHLGEDSEFYLALGARVIAFEANAELTAKNRARFRSEIEGGQLEIVEGAITPPDFRGESVTFYVDRNKSVWGTTKGDWVERNASLGTSVDRIEVPAVKLRDILSDSGPAYYAKIDIEGADLDVLATLRDMKLCPDFLSIESSKTSLDQVAAEIELLRSIGYTRFAAVQQAVVPGSRYQGKPLYGQHRCDYRFRNHSSGPFGPMLRQEYKTAEAVLDDYRDIFRRYARFGDNAWLMQNRYTRVPTRALNRMLLQLGNRPLCGWFDTHARR